MKWTIECLESEKAGPEDASKGAIKPYKKPELVRMGALRDVTMGKLGGGANDGGRPPRSGTKRGGNFEGVPCDP